MTKVLDAAAVLRIAGRFAEARAVLDGLVSDPDATVLGDPTSLGLPRQLQAAMLRLAKAEGDALRRIGYQFHLVPPPDRLAGFATFTTAERREINVANRQDVPRVIHQIWIGTLPVPVATSAWAAHAEVQGYGYRLWREADLQAEGVTENPVFRDMMARGDYPGAVDAARYAILERQGGVYLDCDWYPARMDISFHDLLPMTGLIALAEDIPRNTGKGGLLLANSFIAAPPGHPVFQRMNASLGDVLQAMPKAPAWWSTGPLIFTLLARGGSVTLADAGFVAGALKHGASLSDVQDACEAAVRLDDGGLLVAWKSW